MQGQLHMAKQSSPSITRHKFDSLDMKRKKTEFYQQPFFCPGLVLEDQ